MKKILCIASALVMIVLFSAAMIIKFDPIVSPKLDRVSFHDIWGSENCSGKLMYGEVKNKEGSTHFHMDDIPESETYQSMLSCKYTALPAAEARRIILSQNRKNTVAEFLTVGTKDPAKEETSYFSLKHLYYIEYHDSHYMIADYANDGLYSINPIKESCRNISDPDEFAVSAKKKGASHGYTVVYQLDQPIVPLENVRYKSSLKEAAAVLRWNMKDYGTLVFYASVGLVILYAAIVVCVNKLLNRSRKTKSAKKSPNGTQKNRSRHKS
ncbi:MAG: hypothetical protein IJK23_14155 [Clostridia bacterium]|nr:hypothetical protein [Clostridia bacterium]